jgi:uncharacterized protein YndB with AHSA1/START domain
MMGDISASTSISIEAGRDDVWKAVTTPELIKKWFFGVDTHSDWNVGSELVHSGEWQGRPYEDKGTILEFDPPREFVHTHWSPLSGLPDSPENYEEIRWSLADHGTSTELTISEKNLPSEEAKAASAQAWGMALNNLKALLEGHQ